MPTEESYYDDQTLFKVKQVLEGEGLTEQQALDTINSMLNAGILFRERN